MDAPRENLTRSASFEVTRAEADGDGLNLEGYAAVFDEPTEIDSWEGRFTETIARGAFAKTIKERTPKIQFDHGSHPFFGSLPIASLRSLEEDKFGLRVEASFPDNWFILPLRDAIASGAIDGMSFRFSVVRDEWDHDEEPPARTIREVKLYELGPVVFPAYESTSVGVRARKVVTDLALRGALSDSDLRAELARMFAAATPLEPSPDGDTRGEPPDGEADTPDETSTCQGPTRGARARVLRELSLQELAS